jgi:hypothetical protein
MRAWGGIVAISALSGCFADITIPPPPELHAARRSDVDRVLEDLAEVRGLRGDRAPDVRILPRKEIQAELEKLSAVNEAAEVRYDSFLAGFDLRPPPKEGESPASGMKLGHKLTRAFYHRDEHRIFVPDTIPTSEDHERELQTTLAHELFHAVQFQKFQPPKFENGDEALAWMSLLEGDAVTSSAAYSAKRYGEPLARRLARLRYRVDVPFDPLVGLNEEQRDAWSQAPAILRETSNFPYVRGAGFVVDLYRTGGFALVDRAYRDLPRSSEQILHPQRYLDGDLPHPIEPLSAPSGWTLSASNVLGELGVRLVFTKCVGRDRAESAAEGWGADRAFVLTRPKRMMLAWATSWDTEDDAREAEAVLSKMGDCLGENEAGGHALGAASAARREGSIVAFVRGGDARDREALLPRLLALPKAPPPRVAIHDGKIPELGPPPEIRPPTLSAKSFKSTLLGIRGPIPDGFKAEPLDDGGLRIKADGAGATLTFETRPLTPETAGKRLDEIEWSFARDFNQESQELLRIGDDGLNPRLGRAFQRRWILRRLNHGHGVILVPICNGTGAIRVIYSNFFYEEASQFKTWVKSMRWIDEESRPPVCQLLDPR